jgi:methanethiol S-methyltransferase
MNRFVRLCKTAMVYGFVAVTTVVGAGSLFLFGRFLSEPSHQGPWSEVSPAVALGWDALLCLVFFVQHSGMVRRPFHRWLERFIPPYLHGAVYTFASAGALVLLCVLWQPADSSPRVVEGAARVALRVVSLLALLGFAWAIVSLGGFDVFGTGAVVARFRERGPVPPQLAVSGPYRWVRHPFYFLVMVLLWASPVISTDKLLLNVLFTVWIVVGTRWEERDLTAAFGDAYRQHQRAVPMLIPWSFPSSQPRR